MGWSNALSYGFAALLIGAAGLRRRRSPAARLGLLPDGRDLRLQGQGELAHLARSAPVLDSRPTGLTVCRAVAVCAGDSGCVFRLLSQEPEERSTRP